MKKIPNSILSYPRNLTKTSFLSNDQIQDLDFNVYAGKNKQLQIQNYLQRVFSDQKINITYKKVSGQEFYSASHNNLKISLSLQKLSSQELANLTKELNKHGIKLQLQDPIMVPFFPKNLQDLDKVGKYQVQTDQTLNNGHPCYTDPLYLKRTSFIKDLSANYKMREKIPNVDYTNDQTQLFTGLFKKLRFLHKEGMSAQYQTGMNLLEKQFKFSQRIPQLSQLSDFIYERSGYSIKPVHGMISQRQFLNSLAFKVFMCTQYMRHPKFPEYSPQPDLIHDMIGHFPTLLNQPIADFSQKIGLASLGASDETLTKLSRLYFATMEMGLYRQNGDLKIYGGGPSACIQQHEMVKNKFNTTIYKPLIPQNVCQEVFPYKAIQNIYYVSSGPLQQTFKQIQSFIQTLDKPFEATFDKISRSIIVNRNIEIL